MSQDDILFMELNLTHILAVYGAFLASINLIWIINKEIANKGKLKVTCFMGEMIGDLECSGEQLLIIKATNIRKKPINLTSFGGGFEKTHFIIPNKNLPKLLNPGEYQTTQIAIKNLLVREVRFICAWDSMDKIWKVNKSSLSKLKRDYSKMINGENQ